MSQFEEFDNTPMGCAVCEAMVPEAVDGTLTEAEQRAFEKHVAGCVTCAQEWQEAQRGAAWMAMLKGHAPEPPAALLQRILAETTGAQAAVVAAPAPSIASLPQREWAGPAVVPAGSRISGISMLWAKVTAAFSFDTAAFQPRLAMTAAMAFFSIALTMNLLGIRVSDLKAGLLRPSSLQRTVATASASATRSFQNLRVVYEVESRVSDLRSNSEFENGFRHPSDSLSNEPAPEKNSDSNSVNGSGTTPDKQDNNGQQKPAPKPHGQSELQYPDPKYVGEPAVISRKGA